MRVALAISAAVCGLATPAATPASSAPDAVSSSSPGPSKHRSGADHQRCRHERSAVPSYRQRTWAWQERHPATGYADRTPVVRGKSCKWASYALREWKARARNSRERYRGWFDRTYEKWECVHEHEGSWTDPNPDYYGGLQMDLGFQATYGSEFLQRWGTADNWPVWAQLTAAERAYRVRGFGPWPTYYRYCT